MTGRNIAGNTLRLVLFVTLIVVCVVVYNKPGASGVLLGLIALAGLFFYFFNRSSA